jgi:hypothetical protein
MDEIKSWDHPPSLIAAEKGDRTAGGKIPCLASPACPLPAAKLNFRDSPQHIKKS